MASSTQFPSSPNPFLATTRTHCHSHVPMASSTQSPSFTLLHGPRRDGRSERKKRWIQVMASDTSGESKTPFRRKKAGTPGVDTRIHWDNPDEGWIGGKSLQQKTMDEDDTKDNFGEMFSDLLNASSITSHYQFLRVSPSADVEEIKAACRRLLKEYHPDRTSLPLQTAFKRIMQLREACNVLSKEESRKFYDWTLAQEVERRRVQQMMASLEDTYELDLRNRKSVPGMVDRLSGKNTKLSDQAMNALTFDAVAILFSTCCIIYAIIYLRNT